mgnify:CR=1 FL=1|jgi:hypothetical protein
MIRYIAKSKTTNNTILPTNYASPKNLVKALKEANIKLSSIYITTFNKEVE